MYLGLGIFPLLSSRHLVTREGDAPVLGLRLEPGNVPTAGAAHLPSGGPGLQAGPVQVQPAGRALHQVPADGATAEEAVWAGGGLRHREEGGVGRAVGGAICRPGQDPKLRPTVPVE